MFYAHIIIAIGTSVSAVLGVFLAHRRVQADRREKRNGKQETSQMQEN